MCVCGGNLAVHAIFSSSLSTHSCVEGHAKRCEPIKPAQTHITKSANEGHGTLLERVRVLGFGLDCRETERD